MKLFGYQASSSAPQVPLELSEATLLANPAELREIAGFLLQVAKTMDHMGKSFDHMHLSDTLPQFEDSPAFVVAVGESSHAA